MAKIVKPICRRIVYLGVGRSGQPKTLSKKLEWLNILVDDEFDWKLNVKAYFVPVVLCLFLASCSNQQQLIDREMDKQKSTMSQLDRNASSLDAISTSQFRHGQFRSQAPPGSVQIDADTQLTTSPQGYMWHRDKGRWLSVEAFWVEYAQRFAQRNEAAGLSGGKFWGESVTYPVYADVNELDTLLVVLGDSVCLMQFFHGRWRRAQDVRRWDPRLNDYGACPRVFD